jgi:hypothetical protein
LLNPAAMKPSISVLISLLILQFSLNANAQVSIEAGAAAAKSSREGDWGGGYSVSGAWWFRPRFSVAVSNQEMVTNNDRILSHFAVGVKTAIQLAPVSLRLGANVVHHHEQPVLEARDSPIAAVFGIGVGTRHRAGGSATLDLVVPLWRQKSHQWYAITGVETTVFGDDRGARVLVSAAASLGIVLWGDAR